MGHDDKGPALVFSHVKNRADVRMTHCRRRPGLAQEALLAFPLVRLPTGEAGHLDGHQAAELRVLRLVDHPYSPFTQPAKQAIATQPLRHGRGIFRGRRCRLPGGPAGSRLLTRWSR